MSDVKRIRRTKLREGVSYVEAGHYEALEARLAKRESDCDEWRAKYMDATGRLVGLESWLLEYDPERRCPYWITQRNADSAASQPSTDRETAMHDWISVASRLPVLGERVEIAWIVNGGRVEHRVTSRWTGYRWSEDYTPTHWRPIRDADRELADSAAAEK